jgi:hypothetical protein
MGIPNIAYIFTSLLRVQEMHKHCEAAELVRWKHRHAGVLLALLLHSWAHALGLC